jgi:two-component sensor histidine kinase
MLASAAKSDAGLARELSSAQARLVSQERQIRELNHRIANSLQLAADMLVFEQLRSREPRAQAALEASRARLVAVAELHRYLHEHADRTSVELRPFLSGLCRAVEATTGLTCALRTDDAAIPGEMAQQLAIVINEFAINAAKHAYAGAGGRLLLTSRRDGSELVLSVSDEGKGLSGAAPSPAQGGLGMTIVAAIVRELRGTLLATSGEGATFTIRVPIPAVPHVDRSFQTWNEA